MDCAFHVHLLTPLLTCPLTQLPGKIMPHCSVPVCSLWWQAEVQTVHADGMLALHTRSLRYGKLGPGVFLRVSPNAVRRTKTHCHALPCGAILILGSSHILAPSPSFITSIIASTFLAGRQRKFSIVPSSFRFFSSTGNFRFFSTRKFSIFLFSRKFSIFLPNFVRNNILVFDSLEEIFNSLYAFSL